MPLSATAARSGPRPRAAWRRRDMYPSRGARAHEADQYERENEERMGQLHNRITNLKNVRQPSARCSSCAASGCCSLPDRAAPRRQMRCANDIR